MRVGKGGILQEMREQAAAFEDSRKRAIFDAVQRNAAGNIILDDAFVVAMAELLAEGNTRSNAARVLGIQRPRLAAWLSKGREDIAAEIDSAAARLVWAIDRGEGNQERTLVQAAWRAATSPSSDGTLALKLLERRNPEEWAPAVAETTDGAAQFAGLSRQALNEEAKRVLAVAAKASAGDELVGTIIDDGVLVSSGEQDGAGNDNG